jgi:cold shock CspA family protein
LVACDGDFLPLVRKLNTLGTRVMLLGWDFKYTDRNGRERETKTAQFLLDESSYPLMMHQIIDDRSLRNDPIINGLFIPPKEFSVRGMVAQSYGNGNGGSASEEAESAQQGRIQSLKQGYGFIAPNNGGLNLFFFHGETLNADFSELNIGDLVEFDLAQNDRGPCAVRVRVLDEQANNN